MAFATIIAERREEYDSGEEFSTGGSVIPLRGAMTGIANDISEALARASLPGKPRALLELIRRESQGMAGWQRAGGMSAPGTSCTFDLSAWAARLGWNKSHLMRVRERLLRERVIWYTPDENAPGKGTIGINLAFTEWLPLDRTYTNALHTRPGAGRPKKRTAIDPGILEANSHRPWDIGKGSEHRPLDTESASEHRPPDIVDNIPRSTVARLEAGNGQARRDALRIGKKKREEEEERDTNVSPPGAHAPEAGEPSSSSSSTPKTPKAAKPKVERVLSPDHQYRADLLTALKAANGSVTTGEHGMEWSAAGRLYAWKGPKGRPSIEDVVACYTLARDFPKYDAKGLTLALLVSQHYGAYERSGAGPFRKAVERARAAAEGALGTSPSGHGQKGARVDYASQFRTEHGGESSSTGAGDVDGDGDEDTPEWQRRQRAELRAERARRNGNGSGAATTDPA